MIAWVLSGAPGRRNPAFSRLRRNASGHAVLQAGQGAADRGRQAAVDVAGHLADLHHHALHRPRTAGHRVDTADMIMDAPHPGRGLHGHGPLTEGDRGQVRRGGGEPADGIPAPAAVLIDTSHRQRMQRLHQQGPQSGHRRGQVSAHPPGNAAGPEKAIIRGLFRHTGHIRSRRAPDKTGRGRIQIRRHRSTPGLRPASPDSGHRRTMTARNVIPAKLTSSSRFRGDSVIAATVRLSISWLARDSQPAHLLTRIGDNGGSPRVAGNPARATRPPGMPRRSDGRMRSAGGCLLTSCRVPGSPR
jgi:hypothetical protein